MTNNRQQIRKVIFVASGNKRVGAVSSFVQSQYDSLEKEGLEMRLFPVVGHGAWAHLQAAWQLRKMVRREKPDVIHAHYSVCGHVATIACLGLLHKPKIVVSILGSFPTRNRKWKLVRYCVQHLWDATIVKSNRTANQLALPVHIIPNGVNLDVFHPMEHADARQRVGFEVNDKSQMTNHKYIIWCSHPTRPEKNWALAQEGVRELENEGISAELVAVYDKKPSEVATYMNAADCLLLTSVSEGSPNVIKEAMACNCPIVTTDVGDVNERLSGLDGCYVVEEPETLDASHLDAARLEKVKGVAVALKKAIEFGKRTEGRKRLLEDGLTIDQTAKRIEAIYKELVS